MYRLLNQSLVAAIAVALTLGSIGAIVTVPPAQVATHAMFAQPELA